jgi:hypothetical protein
LCEVVGRCCIDMSTINDLDNRHASDFESLLWIKIRSEIGTSTKVEGLGSRVIGQPKEAKEPKTFCTWAIPHELGYEQDEGKYIRMTDGQTVELNS